MEGSQVSNAATTTRPSTLSNTDNEVKTRRKGRARERGYALPIKRRKRVQSIEEPLIERPILVQKEVVERGSYSRSCPTSNWKSSATSRHMIKVDLCLCLSTYLA